MTPRAIALIVAVSILFICLVAWAMSGTSTPTTPVTPTTIPSGTTPTVPGGTTPTSPAQIMGVWLRNPGGGYVDGLSYADSAAYCASKGGRLATRGEIDRAGAAMNFCAAGWFQGPDQGWYSDGTDIAGCGGPGWHTLTDAPRDKKLGTFCYGQIPADPAVVASAII